jgi:hypothetical protein
MEFNRTQYSLTVRGTREIERWWFERAPLPYTITDLAVWLFLLFAHARRGQNVSHETIRQVAQSKIVKTDLCSTSRTYQALLYIRDHTQFVVNGTLARGWIITIVSHSPTL